VSALALPFVPFEHQRHAHGLRLVMEDAVAEFERGAQARFLVLVWHRRAGKTVFSVMELVLAALNARRERARYAYIAPFLKQARQVAWDYLRLYAGRIPGVRISEAELSVRFPNGAEVRLYGADNPDALRGIYLDGVVLDEVADMRPQVWGEILRPALADRQGWAIFIGTPKGINLFSELYFRAQKETGWCADLRRASDTGVIPPAELEQAKREMSPSQYAQEFECDFAAAVDDVLLRLEDVQASQARAVVEDSVRHAPRVLGVDVARYGDDRTVAFPRQGLCAFKPHIWRGLSTMATAAQVAVIIERWKPDAVFVDVGGVGAGVVDRLLQLGHDVTPVDFGSAATDSERFENKRAEMWWSMAEWVRGNGALPQGLDIQQDLSVVRYTFRNRRGRMQLESKDQLRERGMPSTDIGDALASTFFAPVVPRHERGTTSERDVVSEYDPYAERSA
jgi:phage terminase large subunit-like protein